MQWFIGGCVHCFFFLLLLCLVWSDLSFFGLGKRFCFNFMVIWTWIHVNSTYIRETTSFRVNDSVFVYNRNFRKVKIHHQFTKLDFVNLQSCFWSQQKCERFLAIKTIVSNTISTSDTSGSPTQNCIMLKMEKKQQSQ